MNGKLKKCVFISIEREAWENDAGVKCRNANHSLLLPSDLPNIYRCPFETFLISLKPVWEREKMKKNKEKE
jgi:hypothetical protein